MDAARRQLRTAVTLFFTDGDDTSIHTLVAAARQVLLDLLRHHGKKTRLQQSLEDHLTDEGQKVFSEAIVVAENFFKHADRDPETSFEFDPESTVFMLFETGEAYHELTGRHLRELWVFMLWFGAAYPQVLLPGPLLAGVNYAKSVGLPIAEDRRMLCSRLPTGRVSGQTWTRRRKCLFA